MVVVGGAFVLYRSMSGAPESVAETESGAPATTGTTISPVRAINAFFGETSEATQEGGEPIRYPGAGGTVTVWDVVTSDRSYRVWLGAQDDVSFVVRAEVQPEIAADGPHSSPASTPPSPDTAKQTAMIWARNFDDFETLADLRIDPGPYPDDRGDHYVFTWQRRGRSNASSNGHALLPTWVTVWIDSATGELIAYDSLHRAAGNPQDPAVKEDEVSTYPEARTMNRFTIMAVPKRDAYGRWRTISVWSGANSAEPTQEPEYFNASTGETEEPLDLYVPIPWSLPDLAPEPDVPSPDATADQGG
jgi:hypothetical protein